MDDVILKSDRHNGMQKVFAANYGDEELADKFERQNKEQDEQEAVEAEMGTD